ncbi:MAG: rhomboid family intramembrane serine protease [Chitinophagia bacterium]|jgi:membrane associated rhomboid family serine protease
MQQHTTQKPLLGSDNNALVALLAIHLVSYALLGFLKVIYFLDSTPIEQFYKNVFHLFTLPTSGMTWLRQPWSLFTYNWIHDGFWSLFTNMIWLSVFGYVLQNKQFNQHLFPIYFYSGLISGLSFLLFSLSSDIAFPLMGANMTVTAIVLAATLLTPQYKFLPHIGKGIPLWIISLLYLIIQIASLTQYQLANTIVTIIAGLVGTVYVLLLKKGTDLGKWMHNLLHWLNKSAAPKTNG